jgi:biotin operon repressor BirA-like protein
MASHLRQEAETGLAAVLEALRAADEPVSGESLALAAGVSRAAMWKRINRLKALGYEIAGEPRKGYRLLAVPDKLLPGEVLYGLATRRLKGPIHHFETIASTNDLLLHGKKVGGILTEMETESDRIRYLVLGWGLNVNNPGFPPDLTAIATSLFLAAGRKFSRLAILQAWLEEFEVLYERFLARDFASILAAWKEHAVTLGRDVTVRQGSRAICGKALDVDGNAARGSRQGNVRRDSPGPGSGPGAIKSLCRGLTGIFLLFPAFSSFSCR